MNNNIRIDYLHDHIDYKVAQHKDMYHFNTDTCLLGEFIKIKENEDVLDVGTNNGALLVYIIKKGGIATGIEINKDALEVCKITLKENNINATLINEDFSKWQSEKLFDVIVSNPPYFDSKEEKQKSNNQHKRLARHEGTLNLKSLCLALKNNLKETGRIYLVYRPNRFNELEKEFNNVGLYVNNYQLVYDKRKIEAKSVLIEISFDNKDKIKLEDKYI